MNETDALTTEAMREIGEGAGTSHRTTIQLVGEIITERPEGTIIGTNRQGMRVGAGTMATMAIGAAETIAGKVTGMRAGVVSMLLSGRHRPGGEVDGMMGTGIRDPPLPVEGAMTTAAKVARVIHHRVRCPAMGGTAGQGGRGRRRAATAVVKAPRDPFPPISLPVEMGIMAMKGRDLHMEVVMEVGMPNLVAMVSSLGEEVLEGEEAARAEVVEVVARRGIGVLVALSLEPLVPRNGALGSLRSQGSLPLCRFLGGIQPTLQRQRQRGSLHQFLVLAMAQKGGK